MKGNDESARKGTGEVEVNVRSSVIWHVTLLNNTFFLKCLVSELIWAQDLMLLLLPLSAFALASNIVQIALVGLELSD